MENNSTFNLPDFRQRVAMGVYDNSPTRVGSKDNGQLPNIQGVIGQGDCSAGTYNATRSGAFYVTNTSGKKYLYDRHQTNNTIGDVGFSAYLYSQVYARNDNVVIPACMWMFYVIKY